MLAEPGIEPATSRSQVRNTTDWAMGLGSFDCQSYLWGPRHSQRPPEITQELETLSKKDMTVYLQPEMPIFNDPGIEDFENVGKGENAGNQHFLLSQLFQKAFCHNVFNPIKDWKNYIIPANLIGIVIC